MAHSMNVSPQDALAVLSQAVQQGQAPTTSTQQVQQSSAQSSSSSKYVGYQTLVVFWPHSLSTLINNYYNDTSCRLVNTLMYRQEKVE